MQRLVNIYGHNHVASGNFQIFSKSQQFRTCCFAYDSEFWCHVVICSKPYYMFICINDIAVGLCSLCSCRSGKYKEEKIVTKTDHIENKFFSRTKTNRLVDALYIIQQTVLERLRIRCLIETYYSAPICIYRVDY